MPISQITLLSGTNPLSVSNDNPWVLSVFNTDWFIESSSDITRVYGMMNPSDFNHLRFSLDSFPVIHDNACIVTSNAIIMNPPPIFVPCPFSCIFFAMILPFLRRRRQYG